jgi:hypothetical protein
MRKRWRCLLLCGVLCSSGLLSHLRADPSPASATRPTAPASALNPDVQKLAAKIDEFIAAGWGGKGVKPAPLADDAEYLRRVYLDLAGRIPRAMDVRDFLDDPNPNKRQELVDRLLESPNYVSHFTNVWRALLLPQVNNQQVQFLIPSLEAWLHPRIKENVPYDKMVREILTASVGGNTPMRRRMTNSTKRPEPTPTAFYQANELKPENLAASTSRLFLGVKLECAQCHNHPRANWTRKQFWEYASFFAGIQPQPQGNMMAAPELSDRRSLKIPNTETEVQARFLDGSEPNWDSGVRTRAALASWVTAPDNPFFARSAANRVWAHLLGIGIIEPVDEESEENPPSHPELLNELARQLIAHQFDLKFLIRAITSSQTYQRTSAATDASQNDPRLFARMAVKGLTPEQLYDSLALATGYGEEGVPNPRLDALGLNSPRAAFIAKFSSQEKRTEVQTSILQALALMNGKLVDDATSLEKSKTLAAVVDSPFFDHAARIETLFLATLSRKPSAEELAPLVKYVDAGGSKNDPKGALADVFWALLNSAEFMLNH